MSFRYDKQKLSWNLTEECYFSVERRKRNTVSILVVLFTSDRFVFEVREKTDPFSEMRLSGAEIQ